MLTRLKVNGFKNLVNVDVRFGPFTCIAGANGVGKSNLFDAIRFLSALAEVPILDAALSIHGEGKQASDVRDLFTRIGDDHAYDISIEAEMILPDISVDDFRRQIKVPATFYRYQVTLAYADTAKLPFRLPASLGLPQLTLLEEKLEAINEEARFPHSQPWSNSISRNSEPAVLIATTDSAITVVESTGSEEISITPGNFDRTILSAIGSESPTLFAVKKEIQSWQTIYLEPSALCKPSASVNAPKLTQDGGNLPAMLFRLATTNENPERVYSQLSNRLSELISDVRDVTIDIDQERDLLTLMLKDRSGAKFSARSLSDGTLRFLALVALEMDTTNTGLYCIEEPENGLHPARIPAMLDVLQGIAVDTDDVVDEVNPLRQVIINTHSPAVVQQVPDDSLLLAYNVEQKIERKRISTVQFRGLENTWRKDERPISRGDLLTYLNPVAYAQDENAAPHNRVIDRPDLKELKYPPRVENE